MCGIVAWLSGSTYRVRPGPLAAAIDQLRHRGPDQQRLFLWRHDKDAISSAQHADRLGDEQFSVGLAHSRLSIIDLHDHANQPMTSPDGRYVLVFNGEIYNYRELADDLHRHGVQLTTASDTEVLLQALITWKENVIAKLNGMWAFALFDRVDGELLISRDRFGKKPLFYYHDEQQFVMASEFKAIFAILGESRRRFNDRFMSEFLVSNWPTFDDHSTAYENIYSVEPGSIMRLRISDLTKWSDPIETVESTLHRLEERIDVPATVSSAVQLRLRSDVPTAILLSGGVDSSIVAGYAKLSEEVDGQIRWYTGETQFGKDTPYARDVANSLGVELTTVEVANSVGAIELLYEMNSQYEIPIRPNGNSVAMYQMYKAMAKDGIRVVLDGTGGDEIFGGYFKSYANNVVADHIRNFRWFAARRFIRECDTFDHYDSTALRRRAIRTIKHMLGFGTLDGTEFATLFQTQLRDVRAGVLPRWLYMNDQNSMAHSIEARSPMLDYRLLAFLRRPVSDKFHRGFNKWALRKAIPNNISDAVRWRRDKQGFRYNPAYAIRDKRDEINSIIRTSSYLTDHNAGDLQDLKALPWQRLLAMCSIAILEQANKSRRSEMARNAA